MRRPVTQAKPAPPRAANPVRARPGLPAWLLAGWLVLGTMVLYWPAMRCDFVNYDDGVNLTANEHVQNGLSWEGIKWAFLNPLHVLWQPLTALSHMAVCQVCGLNPWGHHLASVVLHAFNVALVFALLQRMTGAAWRSLWVAALFSLHPLRVESVAWVSERRDVLSTFLGLLALMAYACYAEKSRFSNQWSVISSQSSGMPAADHGPRTTDNRSLIPDHRSLFYLLSLFLLALGLMSKPTLVTWPCVMLLLDYWPLRRNAECGMRNAGSGAVDTGQGRAFPWTKLVWEKAPFFVLAVAASIVTFMVQQRTGALAGGKDLPLGARVGNALISYCRYLEKVFWPKDLAVFYPHPGHWPLARVLLAGGLILGLSVLVWVQRRRYSYLLVGWLWYCGTLVPVSQVVQTGSQAMADRWTYLPSLGVLIVVVWGAYELTRRWRYQALGLSMVGGAAIVLCLALTRQQIGYWRDSEALFRHALEVTEDNYLAHNNLGLALGPKGQTDEAIRQYQEALRLKPGYADAHNNLGYALDEKGQLNEAIHELQEAIHLKPDDALPHNNLGAALCKKGQIEESIRQYQEALRLKPNYANARNGLGAALARKGQLDEAIRQFREAIRLKPDHAEAHNNLGYALREKGQLDEAIRQYQEAMRLQPGYANAHYNLGIALGRKGQSEAAIRQYQEAIRLKPGYADAHNNLGTAFYQQRRTDEAIRQYQEALRLKPDYAEAYNNLGAALAMNGQIDEAIRHFEEALRLEPDYAGARQNLDAVLATKAHASPPPGGATNP
jgi:protein O-mannosyl-transferase